MVGINIQINNLSKVTAQLKAVGEDITDLQEGLTVLGKDLQDYFSTVPFAFLGSNYGQKWPEVTPARLAYKQKHHLGLGNIHATLVATGEMKKSFIYGATKNQLILGNTKDYFGYHQLGTGKSPKRVMMAVSPAVKTMAIQDISAAIQKKIDKVKPVK